MRIRLDRNANYRATFLPSGKTLRFKIDPSKPFAAPATPEIEDVAINDKCLANCSYCYTSATKDGKNFDNICRKAEVVWGSLSPQERPFQIAIGGAGESTLHPNWVDFVRTVRDLGILPNYTTNGMHLSDDILSATAEYCGGVALSWHPHISRVFTEAVKKLTSIKSRVNFHIIVGTPQSLEDAKRLYEQYNEVVEYFVILPYQAAGRGTSIEVESTWKECFAWISGVNSRKFAFGALFYDFLKRYPTQLDMDVYEPEIFSGYRVLNETFRTLRKSSYDLRPKSQQLTVKGLNV